MSDIDYTDLDNLFKNMDQAASRADEALKGSLAAQYRELRSLDPAIFADLTPDTSDEAMYEELMAVVMEASARNESQAQLGKRINQMGGLAIEIAQRVPTLLALL